jgi:hypothetical protein
MSAWKLGVVVLVFVGRSLDPGRRRLPVPTVVSRPRRQYAYAATSRDTFNHGTVSALPAGCSAMSSASGPLDVPSTQWPHCQQASHCPATRWPQDEHIQGGRMSVILVLATTSTLRASSASQ